MRFFVGFVCLLVCVTPRCPNIGVLRNEMQKKGETTNLVIFYTCELECTGWVVECVGASFFFTDAIRYRVWPGCGMCSTARYASFRRYLSVALFELMLRVLP